MKKILAIVLALSLLLCGCGSETAEESTDTTPTGETVAESYPDPVAFADEETPYASRFDTETVITLSDDGITVNGGSETESVYTSGDITFYEDRDTYDSGNPYGAGTDADKHTAEEAAGHTVVNITEPGAYRVTGTLSAGQIRIDLGATAYYNEDAVVELILDNADITCTVAPAIVFVNVYECDGEWSADTATSQVDTTAAGANLILEGENTVSGSYVAKIYKDAEGEKKLCKQDGAVYSYMSMNVYGPGTLDLTAENEGLDSELHLTIWGGKLNIRAQNDGINTNEDGVSVTTINAGTIHIIAGLGEEGDGIDSNGYLVINGGTVVASANPAADAGLDSDMGSYINGGIVIALGSTMDWAESDSDQVTLNLRFAQYQSSGSAIVISYPDGTVVFAYDPSQDEVLGENTRQYMGAIISTPNLLVGQRYHITLGAAVSGTETGGVYEATTVTGYTGGTRMRYSGTDMGFGGMMGGMGGQGNWNGEMPENFDPGSMEGTPGEMPEGFDPGSMEGTPGEMPEGAEGQMGGRGQWNGQGEDGTMPTGQDGEFPEGIEDAQTMENDFTLFYITDKVNAFSGITAAE